MSTLPSDRRGAPPTGRVVGRVAGETLATLRAQPLVSIIVAVVAAAVTTTVLATTGQTAAAEAAVLAKLDEHGSRTVRIVDPDGQASIPADAIARLSGAGGIAWAAGLGPATVGHNAQLPDQPVTVRALVGDPATIPALRTSLLAPPHSTLVGADALARLRMDGPAGGILLQDGTSRPVRGVLVADGALAELNDDVTTLADAASTGPLRSVIVEATDVSDVGRATRAAVALLGAARPQHLEIRSPTALADLQRAIAGDLGRHGRDTLALIMLAGLALLAITVFGHTSSRRSEFGRRRALGASRPVLVALVVGHSTIAAVPGAMVGATIGLMITRQLAGGVPAWSFTLGVGVLTVLVAAAAALPPALVAAHRDPVRVLRRA